MLRGSHPTLALSALTIAALATTVLAISFDAGAAPAGVTITTIVGAGDVLQPAQRLRPPAPENFPMQVTPRCMILDNFGDPRSGGRTHEGVDIMATLGQEVYAMADGTLTYQNVVGDGRAGTALSGHSWKLTSVGGGTYWFYAHLSNFAPGLAKGSTVFKGEVIGYVGDTGNPGTGNYHLHFEWHPGGGAAVNPLGLMTVPPQCSVV